MPKKVFTDELKAAFLAAVKVNMDKGWSVSSAYRQAAAEYAQEGKPVPSRAVFYRWLRSANRPTSPTGPTYAKPTGPGEPEPEGPEGQPEESPELDDYTARLEMMVRLYRRRSEADVDAVCDCLLPDLLEEE